MSISASVRKVLPQNLKTLLRVIYTTKNWAEVLSVKFGLKKECVARFRNKQTTFGVNRSNWDSFMTYVDFFREVPDGEVVGDKIRVPYRGRDLFFSYGKWGVNCVTEMFRGEPYREFLQEFSIKDRVVVDIGANIGDSAIYFALWGAKKVYAFEPFPGWYRKAAENVKLNHLENVCEVFNAGVGGKSGFFMEDSTFQNLFAEDANMDRLLDGMEPAKKVPLLTLQEIAEKHDVRHAFLKVDCEGYEYDVLMHTPDEVLKRFDYVLVEFHYGLKDLVRKFTDAGFSVRHTKPEHTSDYPTKEGDERYVGYLVARLP